MPYVNGNIVNKEKTPSDPEHTQFRMRTGRKRMSNEDYKKTATGSVSRVL